MVFPRPDGPVMSVGSPETNLAENSSKITCPSYDFDIFANSITSATFLCGTVKYRNRQPFDYAGYKLSTSRIKRLNAVMQTCGFYDEAGEFSYLVGLPGKSGVGGGIVAIYPMRYSVAVWSPRLNSKGNSVMGMKALELLTTATQESIF